MFSWLLTVVVLIVGAFILFCLGPKDAQINLKTGDLRYRCFHVPFFYERLSPPYSQWLRAISSGDDRWLTVATFPLPTSNNSHAMCQSFYKQAAIWEAVDPQIAKSVLGDVDRYIISTGAQYSLPDSYLVLRYASFDANHKPMIEEGWQQDENVQDYLKKKNLSR